MLRVKNDKPAARLSFVLTFGCFAERVIDFLDFLVIFAANSVRSRKRALQPVACNLSEDKLAGERKQMLEEFETCSVGKPVACPVVFRPFESFAKHYPQACGLLDPFASCLIGVVVRALIFGSRSCD